MQCISETSNEDIFCDVIVDQIDLEDIHERTLEPVSVDLGPFRLHLWIRLANFEEIDMPTKLEDDFFE